MAELTVKHASRLVRLPSNKYDLTYQYTTTETPHNIPEPTIYRNLQLVDLMTSPVMVFSAGSTIDTDEVYTDWSTSAVHLEIADWSRPRSTWWLVGGDGRYAMRASYGLLSSSYSSGYTIDSVNHLWVGGNWKGQLLYSIENGTYVVSGAMFALSDGGNLASIYYDVDLIRTRDGETVNVTGQSATYSAENSPYSNYMALYVPTSSFGGKGDITGEVVMTETPII